MKTFKSLQEERGEKAYKQAIGMGLKYGGFGYWKDPQTNETVYKTENDTLVPVEPREESELAAKGGPDAGGGRPDPMAGGGMAGGGGMMGAGGMLQMPGAGGIAGQGIQGAPEPGAEQAPKERGWDPGPDGDTCVGPDAEAPGEVPEDSFVGRTNFLKWRAGPDGDNITTVSLGEVREQIRESEDETKKSVDAKGMMRQIVGLDSVKSNQRGLGTRTMKDARSAADKMRADKDKQTAFGNQLRSMMKIANREPMGDTQRGKQGTTDLEAGKKNDMWRKAIKLPAINKDADLVKKMNEEARGFVKDPEYAMDQFHADEDGPDYMGGGAFGSVYKDNNGNVVKEGGIGPAELKALYAMRDNPRFPTLLNAEFHEPFKHQSSYYNNPMGADDEKRDPMDTMNRTNLDYWDPDEASEFDDKFPTAQGRYAMTEAQGLELFNAMEDMDDDMKDKVLRNFWRARGDLHKAGFSHNDMHGGNIYVDPETGEVNIIDLGLAKDNKLSALMEALGGLDFEEGNDYQLTSQMSGASFPERMQEMALSNREDVEMMLMDKFDIDDEESFEAGVRSISDMMRGDIRMIGSDFERIRDEIPALQDDEFVGKLIKTLYNEIGNSELADRMSDAFTDRQKDTKLIDTANKIRANRGEKPISIRNKNVIPPRNMDFDD